MPINRDFDRTLEADLQRAEYVSLPLALLLLLFVFGAVVAALLPLGVGILAIVGGLAGVFLLSRIKEGHDAGLSTTEAVAAGVERTGRVVTAAATLFCVAIGVFATSSIVFIKELGVGTALAGVIDASVVRAFLVPSLMALLGQWNWWAPRRLRQLHRRLHLDRLEVRPLAA